MEDYDYDEEALDFLQVNVDVAVIETSYEEKKDNINIINRDFDIYWQCGYMLHA